MSYAIVAAGGKGFRFQSNVPKQFHPVKGRSLLAWSLLPFQSEDQILEVIVVYPSDEEPNAYLQILQREGITKGRLVSGGETRYDSVRNGFASLRPVDSFSPVLIHDAARPLVSRMLIRRVLESVRDYGTGVPVVPVYETVKEVKDHRIMKTVPRQSLNFSQTPQGFRYSILQKAYETSDTPSEVTDESYMVERAGFEVRAVEGERNNLKITDMNDLAWMETYLQRSDT